jgi:hypothetical protein
MDKVHEVWSGHVRALENCKIDLLKSPSVEPCDTDLAKRTLDAMAHGPATEHMGSRARSDVRTMSVRAVLGVCRGRMMAKDTMSC